jgi:transcriptional regulator with XRE-family HTH domain
MAEHDPDLAALGRAVRRTRQDQGLTIEELAFKVGMTSGTVGQIERGKRNPQYETLCRIADALGVGLDTLVRDPLLAPAERRLAPGEFAVHFGHLPTDGEG